MDTVTPSPRREVARAKLAEAQAAMLQAASAAVVKGDPLAGQLQALALCVGGLTEIYEASEETRLEIAHTFRTQTDTVANDAIVKVHASGMSIIEQLAPKLAAITEQTLRRNIWTMKLRTVLWGGSGLIALMVLGGCLTYGTGFTAGRAQGESDGKIISEAMNAGPGAATAWSLIMALNDPVRALAACKQAISTDDEGRRSCSLPIWLDPFPPPHGS
jgi:hypothetical protein